MAAQAAVVEAPPWPRFVAFGSQTIAVYEPRVERWTQSTVEGTVPVRLQRGPQAKPSYARLQVRAAADVDRGQDLVSLHDFEIRSVDYPRDPERGAAIATAVDNAGVLTSVFPTARLQASLHAVRADRDPLAGLADTTPLVFYSKTPAILVPVDGQPVKGSLFGTTLFRVLNTRALVLRDDDRFHLLLGGRWLEASVIEGPWTETQAPSPELERARVGAIQSGLVAGGEIDLLDRALLRPVPYVSTRPAELIELRGEPQVAPVHDTDLWYVTNTDQDIFVSSDGDTYYAVFAGRWFLASALPGPWRRVEPADLPAEFARIPPDSPKGRVLASVPGTVEAAEALIANEIPTTSAISSERETSLQVVYDGQPFFSPVGNTSLAYAANTGTAVIAYGSNSYYALERGVWFRAMAPTGPWEVASAVPSAIYDIPVASPVHYVTHVFIDGTTSGLVYTACEPGYLGTVENNGLVSFGTGLSYRPWIGKVWYGGPATYGFGAEVLLGAEGLSVAVRTMVLAPARGPELVAAARDFRYASVRLDTADVYARRTAVGGGPPSVPH